ncbi:hypothetical protein B5E41_06115 [Rhizobium esperanzae]|uniref:Uncharacterized protein n=1 Tax=Rhizobium esperanzae TaxID=1967781 RepID=A0A2D0ABE2_9HYPH|nr:hypothetical protein B5E41_06115 [Rhizobium esperanzae]
MQVGLLPSYRGPAGDGGPFVTRNGRPVFDLVPHQKRGGLNLEAGQAYLRARGIPYPVPFTDDFDDPLPEDFLLRPLPGS